MGFDTAYEAIAEESGDQRWAFGTGFTGPLAGVDRVLPAGADASALAAYCLMIGDDALIMSHRLQQWLARAPELEEETALANIALDLLGQAQLLLTRAGQADGTGRDEDDFAFRRSEHEFRNVWLAEAADADFGGLIARLLVFSTWRLALLDRLRASRDPVLAAVAAKGVKELTYHRDYAAQWLLRLAGGTDYSRARITAGLEAVTPLLEELFTPTHTELGLCTEGLAPNPAPLRAEVLTVLAHVLYPASLTPPLPLAPEHEALERAASARAGSGLDAARPAAGASAASALPDGGRPLPRGRDGVHSEAMADLLAELQSVARAYPGATW